MWLHGNLSPSSINSDHQEDQRQKYLSKRLKLYKYRLQKNLTTKQANQIMTNVIDLSLKAMDISKERHLFTEVLEAMKAYLNEPARISDGIIDKLIDALRTYHLKLELEHVTLDRASANSWISILSQLSDDFPLKTSNHHLRSIGQLIMDSMSILPMTDHVITELWLNCFENYMKRLMNHSKESRLKLYSFLDVIDRITELPSHSSLLDDLYSLWGQLRLDPSIGSALLENDAFEKVLITTSKFYREKEDVIRLHGRSLFQKIHVLLMQLTFWGWHSSITTENFFIRLIKQLDHLELLESNSSHVMRTASFFDQRWPLTVQDHFIHATRLLTERYIASGIYQGTETLMDRFLNDVLPKISPQTFKKEKTRSDFFRILAWLMKGTWSWERAILITWRLMNQKAANSGKILSEFITFLEQLSEQPFQAILNDNKAYLNLKHEAVIALLRGIIEDDSINHLTKVTLIAQLLSEMNRIFKDDNRLQIMKNIRIWFANQNNIDSTTKILTLMCA